MYSLKLVTAPTVEPVSLAEACLQCRIDADITVDNSLVTSLITAAREWCADYCNRAFTTTVYDMKLDAFPCEIRLPRAPALSVTSITYLDGSGVSQTWSASEYAVDIYSEPARIKPAYGYSWPTTQGVMNAITVRYSAGYGATAADVPASIRAAMKLMIAHWYANRENAVIGTITANVPDAAQSLLNPYRLLEAG